MVRNDATRKTELNSQIQNTKGMAPQHMRFLISPICHYLVFPDYMDTFWA